MTVQSIVWVLEHSQASGNDRCVLIAIANRFDPEEPTRCWPGIETLAREANVSPRTVQRSLKSLQELGELVVHKNAGGNEKTRRDQRPNLYVMPAMMTGRHSDTSNENGVTDEAERGDKPDATGCQNEPDGVTGVSPDLYRYSHSDSDRDFSLSEEPALNLAPSAPEPAERDKVKYLIIDALGAGKGAGYKTVCEKNFEKNQGERLDGWLRTRPDMSAQEIARKVVNYVCHGCDDEYLIQGDTGMYRCPECTHREIPLGSNAAFYYGPLVEAPT